MRAVIFDLDETLCDRTALVRRLIAEQHVRFSGQFEQVDRKRFLARFEELEQHGYVGKDLVYARLVDEFSLPVTLTDLLLADYRDHYAACAVGFPHLHAVLGYLTNAGLRLAIISNGNPDRQIGVIRTLRIENFFGSVLISEREGLRKPEPAIYIRALEQLAVTADATVMVGDNPGLDIIGARAAGLKTIWKSVPYRNRPEEADAACDCLTELPDLIAALGG
jgi:putative hydrolase of the HAD superfamily